MENTEIDKLISALFKHPQTVKSLIQIFKYTKSVKFFDGEGHTELVDLQCITAAASGKEEAHIFVLSFL